MGNGMDLLQMLLFFEMSAQPQPSSRITYMYNTRLIAGEKEQPGLLVVERLPNLQFTTDPAQPVITSHFKELSAEKEDIDKR
jgi:hypothetical protein